jgi:hypothetical protein
MSDWKTVRVKGLDKLVEAMERADDKGYLPDAIREEWDAFMLDIADGGKGEAVCDRIICWHNRSCVNDDAATMRNCPHRAAPQAECAPREAQPWRAENVGAIYDEMLAAAPTPERAQPVGPRTTLNYDGTFDTPCAHCGGNGCFACLKSAAPTPERADAGKEK